MKTYSTGLEIKKKIIQALKGGPVSLRKLETRLNIGYNSIKRHCQELEYLKIVKISKSHKDSVNGRPYFIVELTESGRSL
jgi:predicted ArsR family transcriptional regulator